MPNPYYNGGAFPATGAPATSASMRAELASISAGFDKLPTLSTNAGRFALVNASATALTVSSVLSEASGNITIAGGLAVTGTLSGTGFSSYLASPPAIGGTTPAAASFTTLTTSGAVTVNGGTANQVQYLNASKVLSGSANLTFDGTTLTAAGLAGPLNGSVGATTPNTGAFTTLSASSTVSGAGFSAYLASPPAIGGTAAAAGAFTTLSASGAVTLSGGAANGVLYLNGSKVATSGSALTFDGTSLGLGRSAAFLSGAGIEVYRNGVATLRLSNVVSGQENQVELSAETNGPFRFNSLNNKDFAWAFASSEQMRLTSTGLGVGTSSPSAKLTVNDANNVPIRIGDISAAPVSQTAVYVGASTSALSGAGNGDLVLISRTSDARSILFYTGNGTAAERMRLDSSGNLGIGTSSPAGKVDSVSNAYAAFVARASTSGAGQTVDALKATDSAAANFANAKYSATAHIWNYAGATEGMRLDSSGNLGIGTSSPIAKLTISNGNQALIGGGGTTVPALSTALVSNEITSNAAATGQSDYGFLRLSAGGGTAVGYKAAIDIQGYGTTDNSQIRFYTSGTQRAIIDSSGNLGLGVTPSAWSGVTALQIAASGAIASDNSTLDINANAYYNAGYKYIRTQAASRYTQTAGAHQWYTAPSGTAGNAISFTQAMTLDASGKLAVGTTGPINNNMISSYGANQNGFVSQVTNNIYSNFQGFNSSGVATFQVLGSGIAQFFSGAAGTLNYLDVGRTAGETRIGVAAATNDFLTGTAAGDSVFYKVNAGNAWYGTAGSGAAVFATNNTERARITSTGNVVAGGSVALATTATDGFLYVPTCAGTPTGVPTAITGMAPIVVNTTNNKLYFYSGGAWRDAGP